MLQFFNLKTQLIKLNFHEVNSFLGFLGGMSWKLSKGFFILPMGRGEEIFFHFISQHSDNVKGLLLIVLYALCLLHVLGVSVHYEESPPGAYLELDG
jgi:hypothetical protein